MTGRARVPFSPTAIALGAVLLLLGAGATYQLVRERQNHGPAPSARLTSNGRPADGPRDANDEQDDRRTMSPSGEVVVSIAQDAIERAGIAVRAVGTSRATGVLILPAVIEPNAYRVVSVTPLVGGRVSRVTVQLGDHVARGQDLAQIYSPGLAEAQTRYVAAVSMLHAHDLELKRTQKLAQIGAASTQELERAHAEHAAQAAEVESERAGLVLLGAQGLTDDAGSVPGKVSPTSTVRAPIGGVVTQRQANAGANVEPSTPLFTIVDLSTVWVVGNVFEKDFAAARIGARATVTTEAYPALALQGKVSYIDPQVDPTTRTAQLRVEVENPRQDLRLGMYAQVAIESEAAKAVTVVPRVAVQTLGARTVVYVVNPRQRGQFIEREVHLGRSLGEQLEVLAGLSWARSSWPTAAST